jgi:glycosyltransferase involved in cell wall biosynthesis
MNPTFTVVIPVHQGADCIGRAVKSVLAQEFDDFELVVIDDGSDDGSAAIARSAAAGDQRVRVVSQDNRGRSAARNEGARMGTATYLIFLDADDEARPHWLKRLWDAGARRNADVVICGEERTPTDGSPSEIIHPGHYGPMLGNLLGPYMPGMFAIAARLFHAVGGYAEDMSFGENFELALRVSRVAAETDFVALAVDEPLIVRHWKSDRLGYERARYDSARIMLERHRDLLSAHPSALSNQYAVLGVSAAKLGRRREAAAALCKAIVADPRRGRNYARLVRIAMPMRGAVQSAT